jgi:outer membrane protein TolC
MTRPNYISTLRLVTSTVILVCVSSFLAEPALAAETGKVEQGSKLTWNQAVQRMEQSNPLMKAARAGLDAFKSKLSQAQWAYFPKFRLEATFAPTPAITGSALETVVDFDRWGIHMSARMTLAQPIYTFGKVAALSRAASHGVNIGRSLVEAARYELRYRLGQAWYGVLLAKELNAILSEGKKWLSRAEKKMIALRDTDSDQYKQNEHLRLKTRVSEFYAMEAENNELRVKGEVGLKILLSSSGKEMLDLSDSLEPIAFRIGPVDTYWKLAQRQEPKLQAARWGARAKGALSQHKFAKLWPDLVLVGEAGTRFSDVVEIKQSSLTGDAYNGSSAAALLALRWNLDVPTLLNQAEEAESLALRAGFQAELVQDQLELRIRSLYQRLIDKKKLVKVYATSQKAAQGWLMSAWELYDDGFGEFRMVMEALIQFYGKKVAYLRAVFEHNVLVHEFSQAVGTDITALHVHSGTGSEAGPSEP